MKHKNWILITLSLIVIVVLVSLTRAKCELKSSNKSFQEEMALRLDLEEKISGMEKEYAAVMAEMKDLKRSLDRKSEEIDSLKEEIFQEQQEKQALNKELKKTREQLDILASLSQQL